MMLVKTSSRYTTIGKKSVTRTSTGKKEEIIHGADL